MCCYDVGEGLDLTDDALCQSEAVDELLRDGVCYADFLRFSPRVFTRPPRPQSWGQCNNAQKRLMLYAALHRMIYRGEGRTGRRDPLPECVKQRVRSVYP